MGKLNYYEELIMEQQDMFDKDENVEVHTCVLCNGDIEHQRTPDGQVFWNKGHNAEPLAEGACCEVCNNTKVIPARLSAYIGKGAQND